MKRSIVLWILAFIITAASAIYQRMTGPTYPLTGEVKVNSIPIYYKFPHSHGGETGCPIEIQTNDQSITGSIEWKRYKTDDEWSTIPMSFQDNKLMGELPHQPPAGKLMYRVHLKKDETSITITDGEGIVVRFKGDVPLFVLIPHVFLMFGGMLLSLRAALEVFNKNKNLKKLIYVTVAFLLIGGFFLGPVVQKYAFGAYWTGWPFGNDLTDNKTALAIVSWLVAALMVKRSKHPERWAIVAAIITFAVYLIPHSMFGSELDYKKMDKPVSSQYVSSEYLRS